MDLRAPHMINTSSINILFVEIKSFYLWKIKWFCFIYLGVLWALNIVSVLNITVESTEAPPVRWNVGRQ